jgi:NADH-quinone oxidoreductase subunit J
MSRPRLIPLGRHLLPGLVAVGLFATMAATFLTVGDTDPLTWAFTDPGGVGDVGSVVSGIGYALLGQPAQAGAETVYQETESFLVALIVLAVVLDAALDGALMLADRDNGGDGQ